MKSKLTGDRSKILTGIASFMEVEILKGGFSQPLIQHQDGLPWP